METSARSGSQHGRSTAAPGATRHRRWRCAAVLVALFAVQPAVAEAAPCWLPPARGEVVDPFRPPACPWCPGNRGIEYRTEPGEVRAVAAGTVSFAGSVAGTRYVVVDLPGGWKLTYGRLATVAVRRGDRVLAGSIVGGVAGELFFGLRIDGGYADPAPFLGRLVGFPRLVPVDGTPPRTAPPPRLVCGPR